MKNRNLVNNSCWTSLRLDKERYPDNKPSWTWRCAQLVLVFCSRCRPTSNPESQAMSSWSRYPGLGMLTTIHPGSQAVNTLTLSNAGSWAASSWSRFFCIREPDNYPRRKKKLDSDISGFPDIRISGNPDFWIFPSRCFSSVGGRNHGSQSYG